MTAFMVTFAIIVALIVIGLFVNIYFFKSGAFQRRRARRRAAREEQVQRVSTAALEEQYYTSLGIGPTKSEGE
ncbi:MAG TPA: hypothetical protein DHW02_16820 [Ktedonobacter sp.]|nr:hypothetical protein [Ktedonobacter sp.]